MARTQAERDHRNKHILKVRSNIVESIDSETLELERERQLDQIREMLETINSLISRHKEIHKLE